MPVKKYKTKRDRIRARIRSKVLGTPQRPRLSIFRSHKHIYAQVIDDTQGKTLVMANDLELSDTSSSKSDKAKAVGELIAQKARDKKIKLVVFDRGGYKYHGRIKALAEGAREKGLEF